MNIPSSRKREFNEKEVTLIHEAIRASGLDPGSITVAWDTHWVRFDRAVEIQPILFDCRGLLDTPCWTVQRFSAPESHQACSCGELVRDAATGTYGSLKTAVAAAIAEVVRLRVLENLADSSEPILKEHPPKERPPGQPASCGNDFITDCVRR